MWRSDSLYFVNNKVSSKQISIFSGERELTCFNFYAAFVDIKAKATRLLVNACNVAFEKKKEVVTNKNIHNKYVYAKAQNKIIIVMYNKGHLEF